jgi:hypothetical protein
MAGKTVRAALFVVEIVGIICREAAADLLKAGRACGINSYPLDLGLADATSLHRDSAISL